MNCLPKDLAVVISGIPAENIGRVIRVTHRGPDVFGYAMWHYEGQLTSWTGKGRATMVPDSCLKPLRDAPGTDEMLRIAGHPLSQSHRSLSPHPQKEFMR